MKMKRGFFGRKALLVLSVLILGVAGNAAAVPISPGERVFTTGTTAAARPELAGCVIVDELIPFTGVNRGNRDVRFTGTLQTRIVKEDVAGTLDFYFRIFNDQTSLDAINRLSIWGFDGFTTDVDWRIDGLGDVAPLVSQRFGPGSIIDFIFDPPSVFDSYDTRLHPGESSRFFFIKTDATSYTSNTTFISTLISNDLEDGVYWGDYAGVHTYYPATADVPEPSTLLLLGSGLVGLGFFRRKKNNN